MKTAILILLFVGACAVDAPETSTSAQAVGAPSAHCVLCGEDSGGGDGGGSTLSTFGATTNYLNDNFPGWQWEGAIGCADVVLLLEGGGSMTTTNCSASFSWHGVPVSAGCLSLPPGDDDGPYDCDSTL